MDFSNVVRKCTLEKQGESDEKQAHYPHPTLPLLPDGYTACSKVPRARTVHPTPLQIALMHTSAFRFFVSSRYTRAHGGKGGRGEPPRIQYLLVLETGAQEARLYRVRAELVSRQLRGNPNDSFDEP